MCMTTGYTYQYGAPLGRETGRTFSIPRVRRLGFGNYGINNRARARKTKGVNIWLILTDRAVT